MVFNSLITLAGAYEPRVYACSCKFPIPRLMLKALRPAAHAYTWRVNHQDIQILCRPAAKVWKAPITHQHRARGDMAHIALEKIIQSLCNDQLVTASILGKRPMQFKI